MSGKQLIVVRLNEPLSVSNRAALSIARSWLSGAARGTWLEHCAVFSNGSKMKVRAYLGCMLS